MVEIRCKCEEKIEHEHTDHKRGAKPNPLERVLSAGLLQLLRMNKSVENPLSVHEEIGHVGISVSNYATYGKEIETALLEAERKNAEALMEWQKRRFIC